MSHPTQPLKRRSGKGSSFVRTGSVSTTYEIVWDTTCGTFGCESAVRKPRILLAVKTTEDVE